MPEACPNDRTVPRAGAFPDYVHRRPRLTWRTPLLNWLRAFYRGGRTARSPPGLSASATGGCPIEAHFLGELRWIQGAEQAAVGGDLPSYDVRKNVRRYARSVAADEREEEAIRAYVEAEAGEEVVHAEKAASERVGPVRHDIWDMHCPSSRWWVVTNPTNLYDQRDFKSRDVVLTFHLGLALRMTYLNEQRVPVAPGHAALLPGSWRRWRQAFEAYESGDEAENFQAVGVRLRECLVSFISEAAGDD